MSVFVGERRAVRTTTPGLLALSAWLGEARCSHVAMEATKIYWKPVWHGLSDGEFTLVLANAMHVKNIPGRTTDVAVAAPILTAAFHMVRDGTIYADLGADHFNRTSPENQAKRLARKIEKLGFTCTFPVVAAEGVSV